MQRIFCACIYHSYLNTFNELILNRLYSPASILLIFLLPVLPTGAANWDQCLSNIRNATWRDLQGFSTGGTDNYGRPAPLTNLTTAITYNLCIAACGSGPEPIQWSKFSQQFSSWLLPWLALVSQLPFGANDRLDNLIAALLAVGSPTLAAYSLALTVLNGRWIAKRFASCNYNNTRNAVCILTWLQQSSLRVTSEGPLLPSLVVLPENDKWWSELVVWFNYTHTWSISAATSIAWVIIAYIFTVIDSFSDDLIVGIKASGQSIGSVWIWLLPIVVGWLQMSPNCDSVQLHQAMNRANEIAHVAGDTPDDEPSRVSETATQYAISFTPDTGDPLHGDEGCTVPIYNYVRFLAWVQAVETVANAFHAASANAEERRAVHGGEWVTEKRSNARSPFQNRMGTKAQVEEYCTFRGESEASPIRISAWPPHVRSRMFLAALLALSLQWGTTGAGVVAQWFTPTTGKYINISYPPVSVLTVVEVSDVARGPT